MYVYCKYTLVRWNQFLIQLRLHKTVLQHVESFDLFRIAMLSTESEN